MSKSELITILRPVHGRTWPFFVASVVCQVTFLLSPLALSQTAVLEKPGTEAAADVEQAAPSDAPEALVKKLEKAISNTRWTGSFTTANSDKAPQAESYEILKAEYQGGNDWVLTARIAYRQRDVTVPIPLKIRWADRTPVITIDALTIPPLGTFDARVLIRRGSYAGTWAHGKKGGHLFGRYEKMKDDQSAAEQPEDDEEK